MDSERSLSLEEIVTRARIEDAEDEARFIALRAATRPGIVRWRRRARRRAVLRRAWELRRIIGVPLGFAMIWASFTATWGLAGLVAAIVGTTISIVLFFLFASWE